MANCSRNIDLNLSESETKIFHWREKIFSRSEAEYYIKKNNCITDLEKQYNETISKDFNLENYGRLFCFTEKDEFQPNESVTTEMNNKMSFLHEKMSNLRIRKKIQKNNEGYEIKKFLNKSISNPFSENFFETMHIMADLGDSQTNSNIWLKNEYTLCKIKYDKYNKLLWVYPDFSANENDSYFLETNLGTKVLYEYTIENISHVKDPQIIEKENNILQKINQRKQDLKTQVLGHDFETPCSNISRFYIFFEILSAQNFENNNIYVQYNVDLPENWSSLNENTLFGTTQTCRPQNGHNFGYYFDICLDFNTQDINKENFPVIYFEVISRDSWNRYRMEGLGYQVIPVFHPGKHEFQVQCLRICPSDPTGYLRRFFIGDFFNLNDVTWTRIPKDYKSEVLNKFGVPTVGSGQLSIRINVLSHSKNSREGTGAETRTQGHLHPNSLVKSVGEVIIAFRRARDKMLQARNNILDENVGNYTNS